MEKIFELGELKLHNDTVREAVMQVERSIAEGVFISIEEVSLNTLLFLDDNEMAKNGFAALTKTVIADAEILQAVKLSGIQRKYEIEHHEFFFELMKRLERNSKTVYLLGEDRKSVDSFLEYFEREFPKLQFAGNGCLEDSIGTDEALVNEINGLAPDAIISLLPSPTQEVFFLKHKDKLSTRLWYGMGEMDPRKTKSGLFLKLHKYRQQRALERHIHGKV